MVPAYLPPISIQAAQAPGITRSLQKLAKPINEAGIGYTILDESHFRYAGVGPEGIFGYYMTEEQGYPLAVFPISYELRVKPDGFPTVDLLRPTEDLEINGDETLSLEYSARDDFGISEIALITKIGDREEKISLQKEEAKRLIVRDQYTWDLGKLGLRDGEEAVFFLQVFDNDTISGPKIGTSRSIRLKLKNLKGEHQQVADMIRDLNQRMVDLLADHLETPPPGEKPAAPTQESDKKFEQK